MRSKYFTFNIYNMSDLEQYIKFAIDNGYIENMVWKYEKILTLDIWEKQTYILLQEKPWFTMSETFNNYELITSDHFINAIARWFWKKWEIPIWIIKNDYWNKIELSIIELLLFWTAKSKYENRLLDFISTLIKQINL